MGKLRKARTSYSVEIAARVLERIGQGEAWSKIAGTDGLPAYPTLYAWEKKRPEFAARLREARVMAADWKAEEALEVVRAEGTPAQKAQVLMMHAARMAPRRWGAKAGEADEAPKRLIVEVRHFEKVVAEDGSVFVREVLPAPARKTR